MRSLIKAVRVLSSVATLTLLPWLATSAAAQSETSREDILQHVCVDVYRMFNRFDLTASREAIAVAVDFAISRAPARPVETAIEIVNQAFQEKFEAQQNESIDLRGFRQELAEVKARMNHEGPSGGAARTAEWLALHEREEELLHEIARVEKHQASDRRLVRLARAERRLERALPAGPKRPLTKAAREARDELKNAKRAIKRNSDALRQDGDLTPPEVAATAKRFFGEPETFAQRLDRVEKTLRSETVGNRHVIEGLMKALRARTHDDEESRPPLVFLLNGMPASGRRYFVETFTKAWTGARENITRLDLRQSANAETLNNWFAEPQPVLVIDGLEVAPPAALEVLRPLFDESALPTERAEARFDRAVVFFTTELRGESSVEDQVTQRGLGVLIPGFEGVYAFDAITEDVALQIITTHLGALTRDVKATHGVDIEAGRFAEVVTAATFNSEGNYRYYLDRVDALFLPLVMAVRLGRIAAGDRVTVEFLPEPAHPREGFFVFRRSHARNQPSTVFGHEHLRDERREAPLDPADCGNFLGDVTLISAVAPERSEAAH